MAFVDDTSDQQDLPILNGIWWVYHKKCATAEQKWCMQYVFIIYMHRNCKIPCRFLEFWVGDGSVGFLRLATFWVFFWEAWHGHCIANQEIIRTHFIQPSNHWDNPKQSQRTHHQETPTGDFFSISLFTLSVSTPQKTTKNLKKKTPLISFPPGKKTDPPNKKTSTPTTIPPGDSSRDLFIPLEVTNNLFKGHVFTITERAQKNCQVVWIPIESPYERDC